MSENVSNKPADLRARRSRKFLIEALLTLVKVKPFQKITVRDITDEAMVNRSTFYAHFVDKYDLLTTAIGQRMRHDLAQELHESTGFNYSNLRNLIVIGGNMMTNISNECQQTAMGELIPILMNEMKHSIHEIILLWIGSLKISEAEAETIAMFATGAVFGAGLHWSQLPDDKQSIEEFADQFMPLLMGGISQHIK